MLVIDGKYNSEDGRIQKDVKSLGDSGSDSSGRTACH
jgi:hypothetical protein